MTTKRSIAKGFFTNDDFSPYGFEHAEQVSCFTVERANIILEEWLAEQVEVVIEKDSDIWIPEHDFEGANVRGRLIEIQKLEDGDAS